MKTHGMSRTRLYRIWDRMRSRCENPNDTNYSKYGARGIKLCEEWHDSSAFFQWALSHGYAENLTIDRIDSKGDYCPDNCRWATYKEQTNHICTNHRIDVNGESLTLAEAADRYGINYTTLKTRIYSGWSPERAVSQKVSGAHSRRWNA